MQNEERQQQKHLSFSPFFSLFFHSFRSILVDFFLFYFIVFPGIRDTWLTRWHGAYIESGGDWTGILTLYRRARKKEIRRWEKAEEKRKKKGKEKEFVRAVVSCGNKKERIYKTTTITRLGRQELFFLFFWRPYILHSVRRRLIKVYVVAI